MKESEIRQVLRQLCDDLDTRRAIEKARRTGKMVFIRSVVGASLGLSGCVALYAAPNGDVVATDNVQVDTGTDNPAVLYAAPMDAAPEAADAAGEIGVLYAAPQDATDAVSDSTGVLYAAPVDATPDVNGGVLYGAPVDP